MKKQGMAVSDSDSNSDDDDDDDLQDVAEMQNINSFALKLAIESSATMDTLKDLLKN